MAPWARVRTCVAVLAAAGALLREVVTIVVARCLSTVARQVARVMIEMALLVVATVVGLVTTLRVRVDPAALREAVQDTNYVFTLHLTLNYLLNN